MARSLSSLSLESSIPFEDLEPIRWYISPSSGSSLQEMRNKFLDILNLMKKFRHKVDVADFDYLKAMYVIMVRTPSVILSYPGYDKELFLSPVEVLGFYITNSLKELEAGVEGEWQNFMPENRKKISLSIYTVCQAINDFLNWCKTYSKSDDKQATDINSRDIEKIKFKFLMKMKRAEYLLSMIFFDDNMRRNMDNLYKKTQQESENSHQNQIKSEKLLEDTQKFVLKTTFKSEAKKFNKTANHHMWRAWISLFFAFLLGGAALWWGINFSAEDYASQCAAEKSLQSFLCKIWGLDTRIFLFVAGIWGTGIIASLRSYFANLQNETSNRQRFNALQSYGILYKAATSPADKSFIMKQAVECAYSHQPTGFVKPSKESAAAPRL